MIFFNLKKWCIAFVFVLFFTLLSGCQVQPSENESNSLETSSTNSASPSHSMSVPQSKEETKVNYVPGSLIKAVSANDLEQTKELLRSTEPSIDEVNEKSETPLMIAVHNNHLAIAKILIDAGANINKQDVLQDSPYLYAGAEGRTEILTYMLAHATPDQAITNRFGGNALIPAAEKGHLDNVKILLADKRVNVNHQNNYGYTALIEAVALRDGSQIYQEIVAELLKNGADPTILDNYGKSAQDYADQLGYGTISKMLQEAHP